MRKQRVFKGMLWIVLLASLIGMTACTPTPEATAVAAVARAWIDFPRDGATIPVGASVVVVSHAYAADGITEVLLSVNGVAYRRDPPAAVGDTLVEVRQMWMPTEPGLHTLEVRAYNAAGQVGSADAITVRVSGDVTPVTDEPAEPPTFTPTPPPPAEPTWTPTPIPPTFTPVPPTLTPTPIPSAEVSFSADRQSLTAGECTILRWDVEHATAVFLNDVGVVGHGTQQVCPTSTTTYVLRVEAPGGTVVRDITITVTAPADTTPPPVPTPAVPADGLVLTCRSKQTLAWLPVADPSGVTYEFQLESQVTATQWNLVTERAGLTAKQFEVDVQCGVTYRWRVRARDGAGNVSAWSDWFTFSVTIG